jgi:hypothetical protein
MFNPKHRGSTLILFLSLTFLIGMIVPAAGQGKALTLQPSARLMSGWAVLSEPFGPGMYDDMDSRFSYSGTWELQTGVTGVTNGTLHVSNSPGSKIEFQFTGDELRIFFQAGPSRGTIRLTLDGALYFMDESTTITQQYEWVISASSYGTHNVVITHESGGPVNLDAIIVPGAPQAKIATFLTIVSDLPDPSEFTQSVPVTVSLTDSVNHPVPGAIVAITGADVNCQMITMPDGTGICAVVFNTPGSKTLTATYQGNDDYGSSVDTENHTVTLVKTVTTIVSDQPDPSFIDEQFAVIVQVTGSQTPTGVVEIYAGQAQGCTLSLTKGTGSCPLRYGSPGSKTLTAIYYPDNPIFSQSVDNETHTVFNLLPPSAPTFSDVPVSHPYYHDIEILYAYGLTGGCQASPPKFCPDQAINRGQVATFTLRASLGTSFMPGPASHIFHDDWAKGPWAEPWAEAMKSHGFSAGCLATPLKYCPWDQTPREQAAIFILRLKHGKGYMPPPATGTLFADMTNPGFYATAWVEQAYKEGLLPSCGMDSILGKPKICPKSLVSRGLAAYMIVRARNLSMP